MRRMVFLMVVVVGALGAGGLAQAGDVCISTDLNGPCPNNTTTNVPLVYGTMEARASRVVVSGGLDGCPCVGETGAGVQVVSLNYQQADVWVNGGRTTIRSQPSVGGSITNPIASYYVSSSGLVNLGQTGASANIAPFSSDVRVAGQRYRHAQDWACPCACGSGE